MRRRDGLVPRERFLDMRPVQGHKDDDDGGIDRLLWRDAATVRDQSKSEPSGGGTYDERDECGLQEESGDGRERALGSWAGKVVGELEGHDDSLLRQS